MESLTLLSAEQVLLTLHSRNVCSLPKQVFLPLVSKCCFLEDHTHILKMLIEWWPFPEFSVTSLDIYLTDDDLSMIIKLLENGSTGKARVFVLAEDGMELSQESLNLFVNLRKNYKPDQKETKILLSATFNALRSNDLGLLRTLKEQSADGGLKNSLQLYFWELHVTGRFDHACQLFELIDSQYVKIIHLKYVFDEYDEDSRLEDIPINFAEACRTFGWIASCHNLTTLSIPPTSTLALAQQAAMSISKLSKLETLSVTNEYSETLTCLIRDGLVTSNLRTLDLSCCALTRVVLQALHDNANLGNLSHLSFCGSFIEPDYDDLIKSILKDNLKSLKTLALTECGLNLERLSGYCPVFLALSNLTNVAICCFDVSREDIEKKLKPLLRDRAHILKY